MSFAKIIQPLFFFYLFLCLSFCINQNAHSTAVNNHKEESAYELELLISGLQIPWGMAFYHPGK